MPPAKEVSDEEACGEQSHLSTGLNRRRRERKVKVRTDAPVSSAGPPVDPLQAQIQAAWARKDQCGQFRRHVADCIAALAGNEVYEAFLLGQKQGDPSTSSLWFPEVHVLADHNLRDHWKREFRVFVFGLESWTLKYRTRIKDKFDARDFLIWADSSPPVQPAAFVRHPREGLLRAESQWVKRDATRKAMMKTTLFKAFSSQARDFVKKHKLQMPEPDVELFSNRQWDERVLTVWDAMVGWARGLDANHLLDDLPSNGLIKLYPSPFGDEEKLVEQS